MNYEIYEVRGSYLSFELEKWQNLPFLGKNHVLVPVPKVGTGTHDTKQKWYWYQTGWYRYQ